MATLKKDKMFSIKLVNKTTLQVNLKRKAIQGFKRLRRKANKVNKELNKMSEIVEKLAIDFPKFTITISNEAEE